ncbi:hypothetical protein A4A49_41818 [Nicotiana attenuata]|uniref:Uncharacterized protein n=1 Tax=Nicotiana attenuata TaxID=49451 RepID=A0A1J6JRV5_NICAT|nr:hypothetical protein A4A49_41818 [Nicotiana attenuata]
MEYGQTSSLNCDPRRRLPILPYGNTTNARLHSMMEESHMRRQGRECSMTLTNSSTTPSPSQVGQMLQRGKPQHNQHFQIPQNLPKQPHSPKGPYFPPPNYRPPTHYQYKPPFRPQTHIPIIPPPKMTQPRPPMNLPPQHMPQVPPRRDNLPPPPLISPQEPRMMNNPLFQHDQEDTLNELDNIQQVFHDKYRGNEVDQRGRGQMSLRTSLKNAKRKSKDERQKIERSKGEKNDNSRVEKGEKVWSEVSELSQEKSEKLEKKKREKKEGEQKESEDFPCSNANLSSFSSCFVTCVATFGDEPLSEVQSTLNSLEENQSTFSRGLMELNEEVQGKGNFTLEELQGKIAYPSTHDTLVDCSDTLSLKDSDDINEFDTSLSCNEKNSYGLQLARSSYALLDDSSSLFNDSLASNLCDVESYDTPPIWDDACDDSFDSTFTLFIFYGEMSKFECGDAWLESEQFTYNDINIKEENFHLYSNELTSHVFDLDDSNAYLYDDLVECEKESKVFDASTSINCFTSLAHTFERTFSLEFANASMRKGKNVSFGVLSDHFEQEELNFIDYFVKVQQEKVAKGNKKGLELTLWHTFCQELFLLPKNNNGMYVWLMLILCLSKAIEVKTLNFEYCDILYMMIHDELGISLKLSCEVDGECVNICGLTSSFDPGVVSYHGEVSFFELESMIFIASYDTWLYHRSVHFVEVFTRLWFCWKHETLHSLDSSNEYYFSYNQVCVGVVFFIDYDTWLYHKSVTFECQIVIFDLLAWTYNALILVIGPVLMFAPFLVLQGPNWRTDFFQVGEDDTCRIRMPNYFQVNIIALECFKGAKIKKAILEIID